MTIIESTGVKCSGDLLTLYEDLLKLREMALTDDEVNTAWVMTMGSVDERAIKEKYRKALNA